MKSHYRILIPSLLVTLAGCNSHPSTSPVTPNPATETPSTAPVTEKESATTEIQKDTEKTSETPSEGYRKLKSSVSQQDYSSLTGYPYTPSTGDINVLVIPVVVSDYKSNATEKIRSDIQKTLFGESSETGWESMSSYYRKSSHGALNFKGIVSDWYDPNLSSTEMTEKDDGSGEYSTELFRNAITWYKTKYKTDCKEFDNNKDGFIDGVFLIYSADDFNTAQYKGESLDESLFWAYTTMDYEAEGSLTSPEGGYYFWASYDFMYEGYGTKELDAHTFIHETGHMLSLDDYYSYTTQDKYGSKGYSPMGAVDMMDNNIIEQDCYSKFVLGWNEPYYIDKEGTIEIESAATSGDCVLIPTKKKDVTSAYDEYVMLELFSPSLGLNQQDLEEGYGSYNYGVTLKTEGIRAYHVDSRICSFTDVDEDYNPVSPQYDDLKKTDDNHYYIVAHSNSPKGYYDGESGVSLNYMNPNYRLITQLSASGRSFRNHDYYLTDNDLYHQGSSMNKINLSSQLVNKTSMNNGTELAYSFRVDKISDHKATITFMKN